jgi:hypothetical protein
LLAELIIGGNHLKRFSHDVVFDGIHAICLFVMFLNELEQGPKQFISYGKTG